MPYKVINQPVSEPITLEQAKLHLKVDASDEDDMIEALITAARQAVEQYTNRAILTQTVEQYFSCLQEIRLQRNPVQAVSIIHYTDEDEAEQLWASDNYSVFLVSEPCKVFLKNGKTYPSNIVNRENAVKVTYVAGWSAASDVPKPILQAMFLIIGELYEKRQDSVKKMPKASEYLLHPYRISYW